MNFSEDPNTASNGGDMGFVAESSLKTDPEVFAAISKLKPDQFTDVLPVLDPSRKVIGYAIYKLLSHDPAGQRELNDPRVKQAIHTSLHNNRAQLLQNAYFEMLQNDSKVTNYFAAQILEAPRAPTKNRTPVIKKGPRSNAAFFHFPDFAFPEERLTLQPHESSLIICSGLSSSKSLFRIQLLVPLHGQGKGRPAWTKSNNRSPARLLDRDRFGSSHLCRILLLQRTSRFVPGPRHQKLSQQG